jgi:hypothetical protein
MTFSIATLSIITFSTAKQHNVMPSVALLIATLRVVLLKFIAVNVIMLIVVILGVVTMAVVLLLLLQERKHFLNF